MHVKLSTHANNEHCSEVTTPKTATVGKCNTSQAACDYAAMELCMLTEAAVTVVAALIVNFNKLIFSLKSSCFFTGWNI